MTKKEDKVYKLMNDEVARPLLKNSPVARELTAKIVSLVLKLDYNEVYNNLKLISEDMLFTPKTVEGRTDVMIEADKYYVNIEICYTKGPNRQKQTDSYVYELFFKQVVKTDNFKNMRNIIQIMIENYDYFHQGKFIYEVGFMEKNLYLPEDDLITKYHISLENLKDIDYNSIKDEKDALKRILYMFVCDEENLVKAYRGDKFMERVVESAKSIAGIEKIPLYLSEEEIRRLDREDAVNEGYELGKSDGISLGIEQGIEQNRTEMIINMYNDNLDLNTISKYANISPDEVQNIIKSHNISN